MNKASNSLWIYGKHTVISALNNKNRKHHKLLVTKQVQIELKPLLDSLINTKIQVVLAQQIDQLLPKNCLHQGIALETSTVIIDGIENFKLDQNKQNICLVALDQITDQHNIGSIIRSAAAFDIDGIITLTDNTSSETSHIAKSASGGLEIVPLIKVVNLSNTIKYLQDQGFWSIGLDGYAKEYLHEMKLPNKTLFIVGSEHSGMRRLTREKCDLLAKIKMSSNIESLNVSVATAIAMQTYYQTFPNKNISNT
jgi:23S rRNA (guanosine2251-2'-O)-methyltransferase